MGTQDLSAAEDEQLNAYADGMFDVIRRGRLLNIAGLVFAAGLTVFLAWPYASHFRLLAFLVLSLVLTGVLAATLALPWCVSRRDELGIPRFTVPALVGAYGFVGSALWFDIPASANFTFALTSLIVLLGLTGVVLVTLGPVGRLARVALLCLMLPAGVASLVVGHFALAIACLLFLAVIGTYGLEGMQGAYRELINLRTESVQAADRSLRLARRDELTGLANRAGLAERFAADRSRYQAALFIDLDRFKDVNDAAGHKVGDELLRRVARRLRAQVPGPTSIVGRIGGDEFFVLVADDDRRNVMKLAQDVVAALEQPYALEPGMFAVSASVGVCTIREDSTLERVLEESDSAMFRAKRSGGGVVMFLESSDDDARERLEIERALRRLIHTGELGIDAQPIFDLETGAVTSVELLARATLPDGQRVPPAIFIPIAEEAGLISDLTALMLRTACRSIEDWRELPDLAEASVAINVSPRALRGRRLIDEFREGARAYAVPEHKLHLEITENILVEEVEDADLAIAGLIDLGATIVLDDFGTGYSSLSQLLQLPLSVVKIDQSLVRHADVPEKSALLMRGIVDVARSLGQTTVAEGIETHAQLEAARRAGADAGQGYLLARPCPLAALPIVLADRDEILLAA